jgi:hypothetical protein
MSYLFEFDAASGLLQSRHLGRVTSEELKEYYLLAVKVAALRRPRAGIMDLTAVTSFEVSPQTIRELAAMRPVLPDDQLLRVIVAPSPDVYGMARMFETHGEATRPNLHVVRAYKEALVIVGVQQPKFELLDMALLRGDAAESAGSN